MWAVCSVHTGRPCVSVSTHRTFVAVRVCPSAHTERLWLSISKHFSTLVFGLSTLAPPVDCLGDFGPRGLSCQYTQDICGCPPAHTGRPTSVAVRQYTYQHAGPWTQHAGRSRGQFGTSVGVRQHTKDVRGCPCVSVCVCVCPSAHIGRPWLSISTHISTLVLGLSTLTLPVDCSGDFGPRGLSVQYTQDVRGFPSAHIGCRVCPAAHTGRPWLSVCVRVCLSAHTGCPWLSISTHISTLVLGLSTLTLPVDCSGDFSPRELSVQYTQDHTQDVRGCPSVHISARWSLDSARWPFPWTVWVIFGPRGLSIQYTPDVRGCPPAHTQDVCGSPSAHTGRLWQSVSSHRTSVGVRQHTQDVCVCPSAHTRRPWLSVCVRVFPSAHTRRLWLSISTHISTLVLGISTLTLPVDCSGDFGPRGLSVQYTQDVRACPPAHTRRLWLSVSTHRTSVAVCVCPWLSVSTYRTSVCVRQHTQDVRGCLCVSVSTHGTFVAVHQYTYQHYTQDVRGCPPAHTQDVCDSPSAHTGPHTRRLCVSVSTHRTSVAVRVCLCVSVSTHRTSVAVHQYTYQHVVHTGRPCVSASHTHDVRGCPSAHTECLWLSVCVRGCPSAHTRRPCVSVSTHKTSVAVRVFPSAHTGRPWLSISTHISTLVVGLSTLALSVDCLADFGPRGLSVQYTHDVRGCPPAHAGRQWLSVAVCQHTQDVRGCSCVSVCVHQHTQNVCGRPSVHISARWSLDSARWPFPWTVRVILAHIGCLFSTYKMSVGVRQHTHDVRGCPSAHPGRPCVSVSTHMTSVAIRVCPSAHPGRPWLSISTHISTLVLQLSTLTLPVDCSGDFGPRGLSVQYTQNVRGCPPAHTGRPWLSVCIRVCPSVSVSTHRTSVAVHQYTYQHVGPWTQHADPSRGLFGTSVAVRVRPCVSVSTHRMSVAVHQYTYQHVGPWTQHADPFRGLFGTHISTLVLGLSTLALPVDCLGDFWPTWAVCSVQTGRPWVSASTHTGRLWQSVSSHRTSMAVCVCSCVSVSTHMTSVGVRQHTQDVCVYLSAHTGRPWLSVCVRVFPSAHTGRPWLSISTHISTLVLGRSTLTLPVDCSGDFRPHGLSVQYTQDVRACPPATHTTSVAVRQHTQNVCGCLCVSVAVRQHIQDVRVCPSAHTRRPWLSVCFRQHTQDIRGCPSVHISARCTHRTSVRVRQHTHNVCGCPSAHTGRLWLSVCVCGCSSAHTGRLCVSVSTHKTSVAVCVCPSAHTGRLWLSISTHISTLVLGHSTLALSVDCLGDFGPRGLSVQYTHDVRGCPPAHTGRLRLSVAVCQHTQDVRGCPCVSISTHRTSVTVHHTHKTSVGVRQHTQDVRGCPSAHTRHPCVSVSTHMTSVAVRVCPSAHTGRPWLSISTHISTLVIRLSTLTLPVDCSGDFGPRGLSVQYTQDVRGCPPAHTGRLWLSVCVCVCPFVSVSTHRTSVAVHQYTYQHVGPWTQHADPSRGLFGTHRMSVAVHQYTYQHAVHTGRPRVSASTHMTSVSVRVCPCVSVCDRQHTQDVRGCPSVHISALHTGRPWVSASTHTGCPWQSVSSHMTSVAVCVCPCVSVSTHMTSVGVRQHTQDVCVCPSAHTGRLWLSVCVRVFMSAHTGRLWLSISTHISTLVLGLSMLTLPVDCSADFGPRGLSVQYTQDVRACPPAHTRRPWQSVSSHKTSVAVFVCPCVSISTHMTTVGVRQHTQDVCVCPSAHTGRPWLSVCVRMFPSAHTGRPWLSISTHISTLVLGLSTLTLPVDCSGDFGPHGLSVQYTQDVRACPPAHTRSPWLSISTHRTSVAVCVCPWLSVSTYRTSVCVRQHTQDVRGCPCVSVSTHRTFVAVHQYTYQHVGPWTQHAGPFRGLFGTSVAVCGCLSAHIGRLWLSVCVRVCPSAHTGRLWPSISTHISTLVFGISTLALPVDCSGDFGLHGLSVQYTQDVRGCPSAHTGRPWVSVSTPRTSVCVRQHTHDIRGYPCVSVSTHRTSMAVHQYTYQHYTQDVRGCPPAHTGRPWLSVCVRVCPSVTVSTHRTSVDVHQYTYQHNVRACPPATHTTSVAVSQLTHDVCGCLCVSVAVRQHTQDVRVCPSAHTRRPWLFVCFRQQTQDVRGCPSVHISARCTHRTSVRVRQHTHDVCGCPSAHTERLWLSVCVRGCPSAHTGRPCVSVSTHKTSVCVRVCPSAHTGRLWLSISTHISTLVLGLSTLALSVDCLGDFGQRGLSVQYTHDIRACPPAHAGRQWLSVAVCQHTQDVRGCPCVSVCVHQHTQDVCGRPSVHISARWSLDSARWPFPWTVRVILAHMGCLFSTHKTSVGVRQHTQDVRGCPSAHPGRPCVSVSTHMMSVAIRVCPSAHTGRPWLSISTHISTLVLRLSTLTLPVDCSGDFGPCGLSVQYTQDVRGCPPTHTGRPWLSVCVRVCPCVSVRTHRMSVAVHQYTYQHVGPWTQHADPSRGLFGMSVVVRVCLCVSLSTHRTSVAVHQYTYQHGCPWTQHAGPSHGRKSRHRRIKKQRRYERLDATTRRSKGSIGHTFTMCCPSQTPHLTMSSARIDPPKRVLGLKEGVFTPPPIHGSFHKVGLESSSTGSSFPADSAKPVPLAVVSLDIGFPLSVPVLSWLFDARGKIPKDSFPVHPLADTRRSALATLAAQAARQQSTGSELGPPSPALRANPFPEVTDPFCRLPLPTLFH
ncbi:hypothetical protein YC2023_107931 [Brassica napus]